MLDGSSGPAELARNARRVGTALESLNGMLEVLTLLSRLEAGLQIVRLRTCELADVLAPTIKETEKIAAQRGIPLRFRNMRGLVRTNPKLLATATRSLLINGIKFGHGEVHACCRRCDNQVSLEVRFRGPSLDAATRRSAFVELPSRADGSIASELGLGLALLEPLCRRLGHGLELFVFTSRRPAPGYSATPTRTFSLSLVVGDQLLAQGCSMRAIGSAQHPEQGREMHFRRAFSNIERLGDLFVRPAFNETLENL